MLLLLYRSVGDRFELRFFGLHFPLFSLLSGKLKVYTPFRFSKKSSEKISIVCVFEDVPGYSYTPETPQSDGETGYFHPVRRIIIRVLYPLHEEMNSASSPDNPDPGFEGCIFIQWMKKRGGIRRFGECRLKARECGFDADGYGVHLFMEWVQNPYDYSADGVKVSGFTIRLWGLRFIRVPRHVLKYADD